MCGVTLWNMYVGRQQCIVCVPCSRVRAYIPSPVRAVERRTERERVAAVHRPYTITHISTNVDRICRNVVVEIIITEIVNLLKYPHPLVRSLRFAIFLLHCLSLVVVVHNCCGLPPLSARSPKIFFLVVLRKYQFTCI